MADEILKDITQLGSRLAASATGQLDAVLREFRGENGGMNGGSRGADRANLGALTSNVLQMLDRVGAVIVELSKHDLVRRDTPLVSVTAANRISSYSVQAEKAGEYTFHLENGRDETVQFQLSAQLTPQPSQDPAETVTLTTFEPELKELRKGERRSVTLKLPGQQPGRYELLIVPTRTDGEDKPKLLGARVQLNVLPAPAQHNP